MVVHVIIEETCYLLISKSISLETVMLQVIVVIVYCDLNGYFRGCTFSVHTKLLIDVVH